MLALTEKRFQSSHYEYVHRTEGKHAYKIKEGMAATVLQIENINIR